MTKAKYPNTPSFAEVPATWTQLSEAERTAAALAMADAIIAQIARIAPKADAIDAPRRSKTATK